MPVIQAAGLLVLIVIVVGIVFGKTVAIATLLYPPFFFGALVAFVAFAWSLVCLLAWRRSFRLGPIYVHASQARAFIWRGLFGAAVVPAFLLFSQAIDAFPVSWSYIAYYLLGGYTALSVGLEYLFARRRSLPYVYYDTDEHEPSIGASRQSLLSPPHRFASWDDEEEHGR